MEWFLPAWEELSEDDRYVLDAFYNEDNEYGSGSADDAFFSCSSQNLPSVSFGHPGKEHGLFGFLGICLTSFGIKKAPAGFPPCCSANHNVHFVR